MKRAVGLSQSLNIRGPIVAWSWPSFGAPAAYFDDGNNVVPWSAPHVGAFLSHLHRLLSETKIHLVAHSMGSRILLQTLVNSAQDGETKNVRAIVFAAGDVGQKKFKEDVAEAYRTAAAKGAPFDVSTVYAAANDMAIRFSEHVNFGNRIGSGGSKLLRVEQSESINVILPDTEVDPRNHSYVFVRKKSLDDLSMFVIDGRPANGRSHLRRRRAGSEVYWDLESD